MRRISPTLRAENARLLAYILACLVTFCLPLGLFVLQAGSVLRDRNLVARLLAESTEQSGLLPEALGWFGISRAEQFDAVQALAQPPVPEIGPILRYIPPEGWRQIKKALITDEIVQEWSFQTYDAAEDWLKGNRRLPLITWDLINFRQRLQSAQGQIVIAVAFASLPSCSDEQLQAFLARLSAAPPGQEVLYEPCQHPPPWYQDQFNAYIDSLGQVSAGIPDTFDLTSELQAAEDPQGVGVLVIKLALQTLYWGTYLVPLICVGMLLLIRYLIGPHPFELGKTIGVSLAFAGSIAMLMSNAYRPVLLDFVQQAVLSEVPAPLHPAVIYATQELTGPIFAPISAGGAILLVFGILVMLWGAAILRRKPPPAPPSQLTP